MDTTKFSVLLTIVGFLYLVVFVIATLMLFGIHCLCLLKFNKDLLPYIGTAIVLISYFVGYSAHVLINYIAVPKLLALKIPYISKWLNQDEKPKENEEEMEMYVLQHASRDLLLRVQSFRELFVTFRLLWSGIYLLGLAVACWLHTSHYWFSFNRVLVKAYFIWIMSLILIFVVYHQLGVKQKDKLKQAYEFLKKQMNSSAP